MRLVDADALKSKAFGDRKGLIHTADLDAMPDPITRCCECKSWDDVSGLTVRMCFKWGAFTSQYEFCSRGKKKCE